MEKTTQSFTFHEKSIVDGNPWETSGSVNQGNYRIEMQVKHPGFIRFVDEMAQFFIDNKGDNYVTFDCFHPQLGVLQMTIQRMEGKMTPALKLAELHQEVARLKKRIAELEQSSENS